jgi:hypothetical protein
MQELWTEFHNGYEANGSSGCVHEDRGLAQVGAAGASIRQPSEPMSSMSIRYLTIKSLDTGASACEIRSPHEKDVADWTLIDDECAHFGITIFAGDDLITGQDLFGTSTGANWTVNEHGGYLSAETAKLTCEVKRGG